MFNGEYTEATDQIQDILIEIGEYSDEEAVSDYKAGSVTGIIVIVLNILVGAVSIALCVTFSRVISELLTEPVKKLQEAAQKLKRGELDIVIDYESQDELGELADNFRAACGQMQNVIDDVGYLLSNMAEGNFGYQ